MLVDGGDALWGPVRAHTPPPAAASTLRNCIVWYFDACVRSCVDNLKAV
jgi:hypothetical protein